MTKPTISVITPCYNLENYLGATIESLKAQTMPHWEVIIIDDCSNDNSFKIAQKYAQHDDRITAIQLDENSGSSAARNKGLELAKGRYITFIDGDDLIHPFKFETQINYMRRNNYALTYTNYRRMTPDEKLISPIFRERDHIDYRYLLKHTAMGTLTPIYDRDIIGDSYRFDENLPSRMDYAFWLDVLRDGHVAHRFDRDMGRYRRGRSHKSLSSNAFKASRINWKIYHNRLQFNKFKAAWHYINYIFHALKKRKPGVWFPRTKF